MPSDGRLLLRDRGFRYGQHLFETLAVRHGRVLFAEEHCELLRRAAEQNQFSFPSLCQKALRDFLKKELFHDGLLRIYLTAGEGAPASPIVAPNLFVTWETCNFPTADELKKGISSVTLDDEFITRKWGEKNGNYWSHVQALEKARSMRAAEGIVCDSRGLVISATMANLLVWVEEDQSGEKAVELYVPSHACARKGVVLNWVKKNFEVKFINLSKTQLKNALALAITNSRWGVMPVATLDGRLLPQRELAGKMAFDYVDFIE